MRQINTLILLVSLCTPTLATDADSTERARAIAPFIDDRTFAVVRLDAKRINPDATETRILSLLCDIPKATGPRIDGTTGRTQTRGPTPDPKAWLAEFTKAGGTTLYALWSASDLPGSKGKPWLIVPLAPNADARAITALLVTGKSDGPIPQPPDDAWITPDPITAERVGSAIVAGPRTGLGRLRSLTPADRPEIAKAFETSGDWPFQILLVPPAYARRVIEETIPTLPPVLAGAPTAVLTRNARWAILSLNSGQAVSAQLIIQTQDPPGAQSVAALLDAALETPRNILSAGLRGPQTGGMAPPIRPIINNDRVILELQPITFRSLVIYALTPAPDLANEMDQRTAAAEVMHGLLTACARYAAEHNGQWPQDLKSLTPAYVEGEKKLVNPRQPKSQRGFVYIRPAQPGGKTAPQDVVLYETYGRWEGINVGFADGRIDFVGNYSSFREMLAETKARGAATAPAAQ